MNHRNQRSVARRASVFGLAALMLVSPWATAQENPVEQVWVAHGFLIDDPTELSQLRFSFFPGTRLPQTIDLFIWEASTPTGLPEGCDTPEVTVAPLGELVSLPQLTLTEDDLVDEDSVWIGVPQTDEIWKAISIDLTALGNEPRYLLFGMTGTWLDFHNLALIPAFEAVPEPSESSWIRFGEESFTCLDEEATNRILLPTEGQPAQPPNGQPDGTGAPFLHILIDPPEPR